MSAIIREAKPTATTSKTDGYTLALKNVNGEVLRIQGVFLNIVKDQNTMLTEGITLQQFVNALRNPELELELQLIEPKSDAKKSSGFFS